MTTAAYLELIPQPPLLVEVNVGSLPPGDAVARELLLHAGESLLGAPQSGRQLVVLSPQRAVLLLFKLIKFLD